MILAGIDEAGYGPLLGPLVVGCCAFEVEAEVTDPPACVWTRLRKVVGKSRCKSGRKIQINDSKVVYSPSGGLRELERAVLAVAATCHGAAENLDEFVSRAAGLGVAEMGEYAWYRRPDDEGFPIEQDGMGVRLFANALRMEMDRAGARCVHLAAQILLEGKLNRHFRNTRNKSNTLFSVAAIHLDHLLRTYGERGLVIYCDRQGGREHYGGLLRQMFDRWSLEVVMEREGHSQYALNRAGHRVTIVFCEKAEGQCLPVAMASMLSKYCREALMHRFNRYWQGQVPGLKATAGYYQDGLRFMKDIEGKRKELGVGEGELVRER